MTRPSNPKSSTNPVPTDITNEVGELHRLLVESVKDYAIFALDPGGYILSWNSGAQRFKGYTADEIIGKHFSIFYPPEKVAAGFPDYELREAARVGRFEDEGWRVRKDGSRFWANVVITALRTRTGKLAGFAKVTRDLTERRAAEQRAIEDARRLATEETARRVAEVNRERTARLQTVTAALSAAHSIVEVVQVIFECGFSEGRIDAGAIGLVEESGEFIRVVGDTGFTSVPASLRRISIGEQLPMSETVRIGRRIVERSPEARDQKYPLLAAMLAPFEATVAMPLVARGRRIGSIVMHCVDATIVDEETLDFMELLADQAALAFERAVLYEAEQRARARADEANRAKGEFLAAMSHELRTPLNAIAGYADLIDMGLRGPVTAEQHEDLQRIKRSQQHLLGIINDILNFSRIEAGKTEYDLEVVHLKEVLDLVGHMIAPQALAKGLKFEVGDCPADLTAWADKSKVEQVLINLVSNAVKFTPRGSVDLSCDWDDPTHVQITVADTGVGIPSDQIPKVFEPFVQVGRSLTEIREGAGLGLAISRDLARAMGGEITVRSTVGKGSTFTLTLPRTADVPSGAASH